MSFIFTSQKNLDNAIPTDKKLNLTLKIEAPAHNLYLLMSQREHYDQTISFSLTLLMSKTLNITWSSDITENCSGAVYKEHRFQA